ETFTVMIDKTAPTTAASVASGTPGNNGWYTSDITITLSASDNLSGAQSTYYQIDRGSPQSYSGIPFAVQGDLVHTVTFWSIDKTTPTTAASVASGTPGNNGWYTSDMTINLSARDNLSAVQSTYYQLDGGSPQSYSGTPFAVQGDLVHTVTFWSIDKAGNIENAETFTVMIDKTAPTLAAAPDRPANADGWYNSPVTFTFTATDALSGVAGQTAPVTLSGEGAGQSVTGTATDIAGNSASTTVSGINIDLTKPTTTASV